jgi:branched-chain amino acid transport system permease protein
MEFIQIFLQLLPQQIVNGITLGATYALIALGYTMVYGIIQLINFAHGEVYMIGAFTGLLLVVYYKVNFFLAMLGAVAVCVPLAVLMEKIAYRPLRGSTRLATMISALGVSLFLQTLVTLIMGPNPQGFPEIVKDSIYTVGSVKFSLVQVLILVISSLLMVGLHLTVKYTKIGKAMRATAESYETANLMGININRIISFTFAIGAALAGAGGVLVGMYFNSVHPLMGVIVGLKCFCAAVLGGIGSIPGAMLGGVFLGVAEVMGVAAGFGTYRDAIAFALLILVLLVKPTGILGRPIQRKV